ncbi:hypothetical protein [Streptomyces sp. NPDC096030]|uniref:hypothetical protein n=1 Tax=Streptomyces sp. NPDC096030 TaxID=3155423 RepID=UPI003333A672
MTPQTAIVAELLGDLPDAKQEVRKAIESHLLRALGLTSAQRAELQRNEDERAAALSAAYTASDEAGHVDHLDIWAARVFGPEAI